MTRLSLDVQLATRYRSVVYGTAVVVCTLYRFIKSVILGSNEQCVVQKGKI